MAMTRPHATLVLLLCAPLVARGSLFDMTRKEAEAPLVRRTGDGYTSEGYGVDTSFPMHHDIPKGTWGDAMYKEFINGCANKFKMGSCRSNEESRMAMNRDQIPRQRNFTELGFAKIRAPENVYGPARAFWDLHKDSGTSEAWPAGNTYVNHWKADSHMVSLEDRRWQPLGLRTKDKIWAGAKPILEAWTGQTLKPTSLYGIRKYFRGGILATHVDRLPLVTSCIINVDQDVDEPWPIEVVGHDGVAYNVTLEPGDMALYESHTVLHGRPFPLKGNFFANVFVHFIPVDPNDHNQNHPDIDFSWTKNARIERAQPAKLAEARQRLADMPKPAPHNVSLGWARAAAARHDTGAKPLAQTGAYDHRTAALNEEPGHQVVGGEDFGADAFATGTLSLHAAAANGDVDTLRRELERDPDAVNAPDENLWTPLHEAARAGDLETVEFLVEHGANIADTTISGSSALLVRPRASSPRRRRPRPPGRSGGAGVGRAL
ncbi:ATPase [Aureococcus anophagefferens]|nr:ATPase [Aureococcus anophagefferens]